MSKTVNVLCEKCKDLTVATHTGETGYDYSGKYEVYECNICGEEHRENLGK